MGLAFLATLSLILSLLAWWFYRAYHRAIRDQVELANFLMEVLTSDRERNHQKANFLDFVLKAKYPNGYVLAGMCTNLLIAIAKRRAAQTVPANRDIYWAMNQAPSVFFENGDPSKPL